MLAIVLWNVETHGVRLYMPKIHVIPNHLSVLDNKTSNPLAINYKGTEIQEFPCLLLTIDCRLISVNVRFVRTFNRNTDIIGLLLRQLGEFHADFFKVKACDFLVQIFRQAIHVDGILTTLLPQIHLSQSLVGERVAHHETSVTCSAAQIDQTA